MEQFIKTLDEEFVCVFFVEHHMWYIRLLWFIKYDVLRVWRSYLRRKKMYSDFYSEAQIG